MIEEDSEIIKIIEAELDWSSRHNKTFRFHTVEAKVEAEIRRWITSSNNQLIDSLLADLEKTPARIAIKGYDGTPLLTKDQVRTILMNRKKEEDV